MLLAAMPAVAQDADNEAANPETTSDNTTKPGGKHKSTISPFYSADSFVLYYDSYDGQKNKVRLSGKVYYSDKDAPIKHILLSCHPTTTTNFTVPSGPEPMDKEFSRICTTNSDSYLLVCPDYCGYGVSSHLQHPYLIHDVTARNCFDALLPAIQQAIDHGLAFAENVDVKVDGKTYVEKLRKGNVSKLDLEIAGFSQGGATALACAKLYDSDACPEDMHKCFELRQTVCGDGPYSTFVTTQQYLEWGKPNRPDGGRDLAYPCVLPLIIAAAKDANNDGCMRTVEVEDYFTPEFIATGILDDLKAKNIDTDVLNDKIKEKMPRRRPVDIMSKDIITEDGDFKTDSKLYKCLKRAMDKADLCTGWVPKHRLKFYHLEVDDVVPYVNFSKGIMGENGIGTLHPEHITLHTPEGCWKGMTSIIVGLAQLEINPDWKKMKHDQCGLYFYASYMFGVNLSYNYFIPAEGN